METATKNKPLITIEDIEKRPLSYSSLKQFKRSPLHFMEYRTAAKADKDAWIFGRLLDCLLLTPDQVEKEFAVLPVAVKLKDVGRELYDSYKATCDRVYARPNVTIVTAEAWKQATTMRDVIWGHTTAKKIIERVTDVQCQYTWKDKKTKLKITGRFDGEGTDMIFELKTAQDADPDAFFKDAYKFDYHIQCATYLEAMARKGKFPNFWYIVIEKTAPYGISVFRPSDEYIELGKKELRKLLDRFKYCMDENKFDQGYEFKSAVEDGSHILYLPPWAARKLDDE